MQEKNGKDHIRDTDGVKITQSGQIFTINNIESSDKGTYSCKAQSMVLRIERLHPVIYGSVKGNQCVCNTL